MSTTFEQVPTSGDNADPIHRTRETLESSASAAPSVVRILGISGSLRRESYNRKLLQAAAELASPTTKVEVLDGLKALPPFDQDEEGQPGEAVLALREAIALADAVLIATPQYNASLPGQLKNALDWASRPYQTNALRGKPVAVIGASPSPYGAARAQAEARTVLNAIGAEVIEAEFALARVVEQFDAEGQLVVETDRRALRGVVDALAARASASDPIAVAA